MLILKRSAFIIMSQTAIYWRLPNSTPQNVPYKTWLADIIKEDSKRILFNYKEGGPVPEDHDARVQWEQGWLVEAFRRYRPNL